MDKKTENTIGLTILVCLALLAIFALGRFTQEVDHSYDCRTYGKISFKGDVYSCVPEKETTND